MSRFHSTGGFGGGRMFPPAIKGLIIANIVIYLLEHLFGAYSFNNVSLDYIIFHYFALFPIDASNFYPWQLISYQFLHGGFSHIFFNMIMLWMFGVELENIWGTKKFLLFYLISGMGAGLVQLFISPLIGSVGPTVGASGSIYGIFLAFALTFPDRHIMIFPLFIPIKAKYLILILVAMDFLMGFSTTSSVAHFAHLGGAATGWLLLKYGDQTGIYGFFDKIFAKKGGSTAWNSSNHNSVTYNNKNDGQGANVFKSDWFKKSKKNQQEQPQVKYSSKFHVNGEEIDQSKIDEILDKISVSGYQALTEREKVILFELSQKLK
jgi:membrane associated rhomboid family serine protease